MGSIYDQMKNSKNISVSKFAKAVTSHQSTGSQLVNIPLDHIDSMPDNSYLFPPDENVIEALVREIKNSGFNDPLIVTPEKDKPGRYLCLSGHQRKTALERLGWTSAPCYVRSSLSEDEARDFFISANTVVRKLSPLSISRIAAESIKTYEKRKGDPSFHFRGDKRDYAAQRCQTSRTHLLKYLAIQNFPEDIQNRCADPDFPFGSLYEARKFDDHQMEMLSNVLKQRDIDQPNIIIKKSELDGIIQKIKDDTKYDGPSKTEADGKYEVHAGKDNDEVAEFKKDSYQAYKKKLDSEIGERKADPVLVDQQMGDLAKEFYQLYGGNIIVTNRTAVRNELRIIEECLKKIRKQMGE